MSKTAEELTNSVRDHYAEIARGERSGCGCASKNTVAITIGYSADDLAIAGDANLGLGCGNPIALAEITPGMTVVDLGSGAGFDAFLAWRKVGPAGRVIGIDMTDEMLTKARENAAKLGAANVEFRKGNIEKLPLEDNSVDLIISNCVINLSPDKPAVFSEIYRVLKPGGRFAVSDIVLLSELPADVRQDVSAYVGCVSGAELLHDYVRLALEAGLVDLNIPQILHGSKVSTVLAPEGNQLCCGSEVANLAARAVASIKLHGRKA
jgi:SAM-dependent methyltransferase